MQGDGLGGKQAWAPPLPSKPTPQYLVTCPHPFSTIRRTLNFTKRWSVLVTTQNFPDNEAADGDHSHEIKRCLLLGRKAMTNLDSILKSRDITLPTKVHMVKAMVFPVVMYGCESWTIKKAEC